jgi:hypothetical protein
MPDINSFLKSIQKGVLEVDTPKPPSISMVGGLFTGTINRVSESLGLPKPFPLPFPNPPAKPGGNPDLPKVPQPPTKATSFRLPF